MNLDPSILRFTLDHATEGVVLCDARSADWPVIYVNRAMEQLTGYPASELLGRNPRFLQANDRDQEGLARVRAALAEGVSCHAMVRNYRRDGTLFWNEFTLVPLHDASGSLSHYIGYHRDGGERLRLEGRVETRDTMLSSQTMLAQLREDKLTGLLRQPFFDDLLRRDWGLAQRESRSLTLLMFELDAFAQYREVFGKQGSEQALRRVARVIGGCFRRASDLCAHYPGERIVALAAGMKPEEASRFADEILGRIRTLAIHHPRSPASKFLTASVGVASVVPPRDGEPTALIGEALTALSAAKEQGGNCVVLRDLARSA